MSFASDRGLFGTNLEPNWPSEYAFLTNATKAREFFINAKNKLFEFIEEKKPSIIGLQEIVFKFDFDAEDNYLKNISSVPDVNDWGNHTITTAGYNEIKENLPKKYTISKATTIKPSKNTNAPIDYVTIATIWDTTKLGDIDMPPYWNHLSIVDNKIESPVSSYVKEIATLNNEYDTILHGGRTISIIFTSKGYILINLHAPNDPKSSQTGHNKKLRTAIGKFYKDAITAYKLFKSGFMVNQQKIFITGDFNDAWHEINDEHPLILYKDIKLTTGRKKEDKLLSCCYNWNSACGPSDVQTDKDGEPLKDVNKKILMTKERRWKKEDCQLANPKKSMGMRGNVKNYIFTGDYCLGENIKDKLEIFKGDLKIYYDIDTGASKASDHEMVYAVFLKPDDDDDWHEVSHGIWTKSSGGRSKKIRRKNKRRTQKKRRNKQKRSHRRTK